MVGGFDFTHKGRFFIRRTSVVAEDSWTFFSCIRLAGIDQRLDIMKNSTTENDSLGGIFSTKTKLHSKKRSRRKTLLPTVGMKSFGFQKPNTEDFRTSLKGFPSHTKLFLKSPQIEIDLHFKYSNCKKVCHHPHNTYKSNLPPSPSSCVSSKRPFTSQPLLAV